MYTPPTPMYYNYNINTMSPSPPGPGATYAPRYPYYATSSRESSKERLQSTFSYASPQPPQYYTPQPYAYANPDGYTVRIVTPKRNDFASSTERMRTKAHRHTESDPVRYPLKKSPMRSQKVLVVDDDPYHYSSTSSYEDQYLDSMYSAQPIDSGYATGDSPPRRTRARAASQSMPVARPSQSKSVKRSGGPREMYKATAADAERAGIPSGYSVKNWDPTEKPIILLGSVFDANSLGKWIYDWTVYHHGASTPLADLAGDLWLLLIQVAGKIKRAEECVPRIRYDDDLDVVNEFLESGHRLWARLKRIIKICEQYMYGAAKKAATKSGKKQAQEEQTSMGPNSGCEFVNSIFGRDRELQETEELMAKMRLWNVRFDGNAEEILRYPG